VLGRHECPGDRLEVVKIEGFWHRARFYAAAEGPSPMGIAAWRWLLG
jgi:hypothetical protein